MNERLKIRSIEFLPKVRSDTLLAYGLRDLPEVTEGLKIGKLIVEKMSIVGGIEEKDIYVVASKIVSKAEGRIVRLSDIKPSAEAIELYNKLGRKNPEIIQVILNESKEYKLENGAIIAKHKLGYQLTSAGVDRDDAETVIILPEDPDNSARRIMKEIASITDKNVGIVISDSEGRPDRRGAGAVSIGISGIDPLRIIEVEDNKGNKKKTEETISDLLAAQASLLMGQRGNNIPIVLIRGLNYKFNPNSTISSIIYS